MATVYKPKGYECYFSVPETAKELETSNSKIANFVDRFQSGRLLIDERKEIGKHGVPVLNLRENGRALSLISPKLKEHFSKEVEKSKIRKQFTSLSKIYRNYVIAPLAAKKIIEDAGIKLHPFPLRGKQVECVSNADIQKILDIAKRENSKRGEEEEKRGRKKRNVFNLSSFRFTKETPLEKIEEIVSAFHESEPLAIGKKFKDKLADAGIGDEHLLKYLENLEVKHKSLKTNAENARRIDEADAKIRRGKALSDIGEKFDGIAEPKIERRTWMPSKDAGKEEAKAIAASNLILAKGKLVARLLSLFPPKVNTT